MLQCSQDKYSLNLPNPAHNIATLMTFWNATDQIRILLAISNIDRCHKMYIPKIVFIKDNCSVFFVVA